MNPASKSAEPKVHAASPRRRWYRLRHIDLGDLAVQTFSVIIGILIALMIDRWGKAQDTASKLAAAREAIRQEVGLNLQRTQDLVAYYQSYGLAAKNEATKRSTLHNDCQLVPGWHGFEVPVLLNSAFETARSSGVFASMDFAESQRIAALYGEQSSYLELSREYTNWYMFKLQDQGQAVPCEALFNDVSRHAQIVEDAYRAYLGAAR